MTEQEHLIRLGAFLKKCREEAGLSQRALESDVNLTSGRISEIEQGKRNIQYGTLVRLIEAYNLSLTDFFGQLEKYTVPKKKS